MQYRQQKEEVTAINDSAMNFVSSLHSIEEATHRSRGTPEINASYTFDIPQHLMGIVPMSWNSFVNNIHIDLAETKLLQKGQYVGYSKNSMKNGIGQLIMQNGDIYKGHWKDDKRSGQGIC